MAKPYSDDFWQKIIQAVKLDGLKTAKPANCLISAVMISISGMDEREKDGIRMVKSRTPYRY